MDHARTTWQVSIRRACRALPVNRSTYHYRSRRAGQAHLSERIREIATTRVRYGYRRIHALLRRDGWRVNPKRVYRLYHEMGLQLRVGRQVGFPKAIRVDQGTEFVSRDLDLWAYRRGVTLDFSRPGKPTDNAFIESFNGKFRAECLNAHWFMSLDDARQKCEAWRRDYNEERPHSAIGNKAPIELIDRSVAYGPP